MFGIWKKQDFDISLEDLGVIDDDLGTSWHPRHLPDGVLLEDVSEEMMSVHLTKEERLTQPDAVTPLESTPIDGSGGIK